MNSSKSRLRPALGAACALALTAGHNATLAQSFLYTAGHADIGLVYDSEDGFEPHWHFHPGAVVNGASLLSDAEYEPGEVVAFVPNPSIPRPSGAQWDVLGVAAAQPIWFLPQTADPAKPFLGIATAELNPLDWSGGIGMRLVNMSGPSGGQFSLWQNDLFGSPTVFMRTSDGLSGADSILRPVGTHAHYNYGFTAEGLYTLTLEFTGTHMVDGPQSYTASYTFGVNAVPEPEEYAVLAGLALAGFGVWRRTRR